MEHKLNTVVDETIWPRDRGWVPVSVWILNTSTAQSLSYFFKITNFWRGVVPVVALLVKDSVLSLWGRGFVLVVLSGLRICSCHGCVVGGSCSSNLTLGPGTSLCCRCDCKKREKKFFLTTPVACGSFRTRDLSRCSGNARSLIRCTTRELLRLKF